MKLSISAYCFFKAIRSNRLDQAAFIYEAARLGADGVELLDPFVNDRERDRAACLEALAQTGLPCPIYSVSNNLAQPDEARRQEHLDKVLTGIAEAGHYGSGIVRIFAGNVSEGLEFDACRAWIVEGLVVASQAAAENGVLLALENHGQLAGRSDQVRELIEEVRHLSGTDVLGANPDLGNFLLVDQDSVEAVTELGPLAVMAHLKDFSEVDASHEGFAFTSLAGRRYVGRAIGEGVLDLAAGVSALRAAGFDGWVSLEYEAEEDSFTAMPRSVANARALLAR